MVGASAAVMGKGARWPGALSGPPHLCPLPQWGRGLGEGGVEEGPPAPRLSYRLFWMGGAVSCGVSSLVSWGMSQGTSGLETILKAYMAWSAWWSSFRKIILPLGVSNSMPSMAVMSFSVSVPPAFLIAVTTAMAAANPPAVKKSGGALKRFWCSLTSQSFTGFFGIS